MEINFDPDFDWLWILVAGQKAPRVDVAATRALARSWLESGATLSEMTAALDELAAKVEDALGGRLGGAFRSQVREVVASVPQLVGLARQQSDSLLKLALNVEQSIYSMMIEIVWFASSIVWALSNPFTAPLVPSFITAARVAVTRILEKLHWVLRLLAEAVQEGVEEVVQGAIAQLIQFAEGNRVQWDGESTLIEFVAGAAAGGLIKGGHMGMAKWKPGVAKSVVFGAANEAAAETFVGLGTAGVFGSSLDDVWTGTVNGAFSHAAERGAGHAGQKIGEVVAGMAAAKLLSIPDIAMPDAPALSGEHKALGGGSGPGPGFDGGAGDVGAAAVPVKSLGGGGPGAAGVVPTGQPGGGQTGGETAGLSVPRGAPAGADALSGTTVASDRPGGTPGVAQMPSNSGATPGTGVPEGDALDVAPGAETPAPTGAEAGSRAQVDGIVTSTAPDGAAPSQIPTAVAESPSADEVVHSDSGLTADSPVTDSPHVSGPDGGPQDLPGTSGSSPERPASAVPPDAGVQPPPVQQEHALLGQNQPGQALPGQPQTTAPQQGQAQPGQTSGGFGRGGPTTRAGLPSVAPVDLPVPGPPRLSGTPLLERDSPLSQPTLVADVAHAHASYTPRSAVDSDVDEVESFTSDETPATVGRPFGGTGQNDPSPGVGSALTMDTAVESPVRGAADPNESAPGDDVGEPSDGPVVSAAAPYSSEYRVDVDELNLVATIPVDVGEIEVFDVAWRTSREPLYRLDDRPLDEVFGVGFQPLSRTNYDLMSRILADDASVYVSTTRNADLHLEPRARGAYRIRYRHLFDVPGGIVVNDSPILHSVLHEHEEEVAFAGGIRSEFHVGAHEINADGSIGRFHPNPGYRPGEAQAVAAPVPAPPSAERADTTTLEPVPSGFTRVSSGPVFGFPVPGGVDASVVTALSDALDESGDGPQSGGDRIVVVVDSPDGRQARVASGDGQVHEIDGRELAVELLADPEFRRRVNEGHEVLLVANKAGERGNFGGLGFDFAGALRAEGLFNDVRATTGTPQVGPDGVRLGAVELVSTLRAGDLRITVLRDTAGRPVALMVRSPGDSELFEQAREWARNVTANGLSDHDVDGGRLAPSPWSSRQVPGFVLLSTSPRGARAVRADGAPVDVSLTELAVVLRADPALRDLLGDGRKVASHKDIVLGTLTGGLVGDGAEFNQALLDGGYARRLHSAPSPMTLSPDGRITLGDGSFTTHQAPLPGPDNVVARVMANAALGTYGVFFPLDKSDEKAERSASYRTPMRLQYFLRGKDRFEAFVAPWSGSATRPVVVDGHNMGDDGFGLRLTTDHPDVWGDATTVDGARKAMIVAGSAIYRQAGLDPTAPVVLLQCWVNRPTPGSDTPTPAAGFREQWARLVRSVEVFGATGKALVADHTAAIGFHEAGGAMTLAGPDGGQPVPELPMADLVTQEIDPLLLRFDHRAPNIRTRDVEQVRETARRVARAAAWRKIKGAGIPEVLITGYGDESDPAGGVTDEQRGQLRADDVAAVFTQELTEESLRLRKFGFDVRAEHIALRSTGSAADDRFGRAATVEVRLSAAELGQRALEGDLDFTSEAALQELEEAFAELAPSWSSDLPQVVRPTAGSATYTSRNGDDSSDAESDPGSDLETAVGNLRVVEAARPLPRTATTSGGVAFTADDDVLDKWSDVHEAMPSRKEGDGPEPFLVFVGVRGETFVVDGVAVTGAELARQVSAHASFRSAVSASPGVEVSVVLDDPTGVADVAEELRAFAVAMRDDGGYRHVTVARRPVDREPFAGGFEQVSPVLPDDVVLVPLFDGRREIGVGVPSDVAAQRSFEKVASHAIPEGRRLIEEKEGFDYRLSKEAGEEVVAPWAQSLEPSGGGELRALLQTKNGHYTALLRNRARSVRVSDSEAAGILLGTSVFKGALSGDVRPTLVVATNDLTMTGGPDLTPGLWSELVARSGPWPGFHFQGRIAPSKRGQLRVLPGKRFTEVPLTLSDVRHRETGSVVGLPASAEDLDQLKRFAGAHPDLGQALSGPWGGREPLVVVVDGSEGHARVSLSNGQSFSAEGGQLGRLLLELPEFAARMRADPTRPVVLVSGHGAARLGFGGLGFDVAGAFRAAGLFNPVYAPTGGATLAGGEVVLAEGSTFAEVSVWRAGDLRVEVLSGTKNDVRMLVIRSPGDESFVDGLRNWLSRTDRKAISTFLGAGWKQHKAPWREEVPPVLVVARSTGDGFRGQRSDSRGVVVSTAELAQVLRDDPQLRELMGHVGKTGDLGASTPLLLVAQGERPVLDLDVFAESMVPGGYARTMYASVGPLTFGFGARGFLGAEGGFQSVTPTLGPEAYVSYPIVSSDGVVWGHTFPTVAFQVPFDTLFGLRYAGDRQKFYFQQKKDSNGVISDVPRRTPWAGKPVWVNMGHAGSREGLQFAVATGRPHVRGDLVWLVGDEAAGAIHGSEIFRRAGGSDRILLLYCEINQPIPDGNGVTRAQQVKVAWVADHGPVEMFGATTEAFADMGGYLLVEDGGEFTEVLLPGEEPSAQPDSEQGMAGAAGLEVAGSPGRQQTERMGASARGTAPGVPPGPAAGAAGSDGPPPAASAAPAEPAPPVEPAVQEETAPAGPVVQQQTTPAAESAGSEVPVRPKGVAPELPAAQEFAEALGASEPGGSGSVASTAGHELSSVAPAEPAVPAAQAAPAPVIPGVPSYLRDSTSLGIAQQNGPVRADFGGALDELLPPGPRVGVDGFVEDLVNGIGKFLGRGHTADVTIGGRPYELHGVARFGWQTAVEGAPSDLSTTMTGPGGTGTISASATVKDGNTGLLVFVLTAAPGIFAVGSAQLSTDASNVVTSSVDAKAGESNQMDLLMPAREFAVPVRVELTLRHAGQRPVGEPVVVAGNTDLLVPAGLSDTGGTGAVATGTSYVESVEFGGGAPGVYRGRPLPPGPDGSHRLFDKVAAALPSSLVKPGRPGRTALREFLTGDTVHDHYHDIAVTAEDAARGRGWVRSESLFSGKHPLLSWSDTPSAVEMRLVERVEPQVLQTVPDATFVETGTVGTGTSDTGTAARGLTGKIMIGPGMDMGAISLVVGPIAGVGAERGRDQDIGRSGEIETTKTWRGPAQRVRRRFDLEVRVPGKPAMRFADDVTVVEWVRVLADAATAVPAEAPPATPAQGGEPSTGQDTAPQRSLFGPEALESGRALAGASLRVSGVAERMLDLIENSVRKVPGHRSWYLSSDRFLDQFDDKSAGRVLGRKLQEGLRRRDALRGLLTDRELSMLADRALSADGLRLPMVPRHGWGHDYHVAFTLRATMSDLRDTGEVTTPAAVEQVTTTDVASSSLKGTRTTTASAGFASRVTGVIAERAAILVSSLTGVFTWTKTGLTGVTAKRSLVSKIGQDSGLTAEPVHHFTANLAWSLTGTTYRRHNAMTRGLSFGSRGLHVPRVEPVSIVDPATDEAAPEAVVTVAADLRVPAAHVSRTRPDPIAVDRTPGQELPGLTLRPGPDTPAADDALRSGLSRDLDGVRVTSFGGLEYVRAAVKNALTRASGDPVFSFPESDNSTLIENVLAPDTLKADPRLFSRTIGVRGLTWPRRRLKQHAAAEVSFVPRDVEVLPGERWEQSTVTTSTETQTGNSTRTTWKAVPVVDTTAIAFYRDVAPGDKIVIPGALAILENNPMTTEGGSDDEVATEVATGTTISRQPERLHHVRFGVRVTVAAEVRSRRWRHAWGLFRAGSPGAANERFDLPRAVTAWVTTAQLAALRAGQAAQDARADLHDEAQAPERAAPVPAFLRPHEPLSLGIGAVDGVVDLRSVLPALRQDLARSLGPKRAARLIPSSPLSRAHDNYAAITSWLADSQTWLEDSSSTGTPRPLRLEDRASGQTYEFVVTNELLATPEFTGLVHGRLKQTRTTTSLGTRVRTFARTALRMEPVAVPGVLVGGPAPNEQVSRSNPFGMLGGGLTGDVVLGMKKRAKKETRKTVRDRSVETSGPLASYRARVGFTVSVHRHGRQIAEAGTERALTVLHLPEDAGAPGRSGATPGAVVRPREQATPDALSHWRGEPAFTGGWVSRLQFDVDDLADGAATAYRTATGSEVVPAGISRALRASLTGPRVKALLPAAGTGAVPLDLPAWSGLAIEMHVRRSGSPTLTGTTARTTVTTSGEESVQRSAEEMTKAEFGLLGTPMAGFGGTQPPGSERIGERRAFGGGTGFLLPLLSMGGVESEGEVEASHTHATPGDKSTSDGLTGLWLNDVEVRFVARPTSRITRKDTAVVDVLISDAVVVAEDRGQDTIPAELADAARSLAAAADEEAWWAAYGDYLAALPDLTPDEEVVPPGPVVEAVPPQLPNPEGEEEVPLEPVVEQVPPQSPDLVVVEEVAQPEPVVEEVPSRLPGPAGDEEVVPLEPAEEQESPVDESSRGAVFPPPTLRTSDEPLYVTDSRPPDVVREEGFPAPDRGLDLYSQVTSPDGDGFPTMRRDRAAARELGVGEPLYVVSAPGGVDVAATMARHGDRGGPSGVVFPEGVAPEHVTPWVEPDEPDSVVRLTVAADAVSLPPSDRLSLDGLADVGEVHVRAEGDLSGDEPRDALALVVERLRPDLRMPEIRQVESRRQVRVEEATVPGPLTGEAADVGEIREVQARREVRIEVWTAPEPLTVEVVSPEDEPPPSFRVVRRNNLVHFPAGTRSDLADRLEQLDVALDVYAQFDAGGRVQSPSRPVPHHSPDALVLVVDDVTAVPDVLGSALVEGLSAAAPLALVVLVGQAAGAELAAQVAARLPAGRPLVYATGPSGVSPEDGTLLVHADASLELWEHGAVELAPVPEPSTGPGGLRHDRPDLLLEAVGLQLTPVQVLGIRAQAAQLVEHTAVRSAKGFAAPVVTVNAPTAAAAEHVAKVWRGEVADHASRGRDTLVSAADLGLEAEVVLVPELPSGVVELRIDWEMAGPGCQPLGGSGPDHVAAPVVITTESLPRPHPVLDDPSWAHSTLPTAQWMVDPDPVSESEREAARRGAVPVAVSGEDVGPTTAVMGPVPRFEAWRHPIVYDLARYEVRPGKWVQEYTARLRFQAGPDVDVPALVARAQAGADRMFNNPGYRLPSGDSLHVRVLHDPTPDAHATVDIGPAGTATDMLHWAVDADELVFAEELGHMLGLHDEYPVQADDGEHWVFRGPRSNRVVTDNGLFTAHVGHYLRELRENGHTELPPPSVKPRNLWLLETRARALGAVVDAPLPVERHEPAAGVLPATSAGPSGQPWSEPGSSSSGPGTEQTRPGGVGEPSAVVSLGSQIALGRRHLDVLGGRFAEAALPLAHRLKQVWENEARLPAVDRLAIAREAVVRLRQLRLAQMEETYDAAAAIGANGGNPLTFYPDGVPGGVSGRPDAWFGFEVELRLPGESFADVSQDLGQKLVAAGHLSAGNEVEAGSWSMVEERNPRWGVELVSSVLSGSPTTWASLAGVLEVARNHRGRAGQQPDVIDTGGHVNVSFTQQLGPAEYARLAQLAKANEMVLYRLGNFNGAGAPQRDMMWVGPLPIPPHPDGVTSIGDVKRLNRSKFELINFRHVEGKQTDRLEFRFWAGSLDPAVWQVRAELSAAMASAAKDRSIHALLDKAMAALKPVGPATPPTDRDAALAVLLDFLELLQLSPEAHEQAVRLFAWNTWWNHTGANDTRLRTQSLIGRGIRNVYFPDNARSVPEALMAIESMPRIAGAEIVAATLSPDAGTVEMWHGAPVHARDFVVAVDKVKPAAFVLGELPPGVAPHVVFAIAGAARGLDLDQVVEDLRVPGTLDPLPSLPFAHLLAIATRDHPVLVTAGAVGVTEDGRVVSDTEWIELQRDRKPLRTGETDAERALHRARANAPQLQGGGR